MTRAKSSLGIVALSYRIKRLSQELLGGRRVLRVCLNASWLLRRFAFELSCEMFGESFQKSALALSGKVLREWIPSGGSVVDIGCGTGRWCREAARHARQVVGIDYDTSSIEAARSLSPEPNIEYIVGDVTRDLADRTFDVGLLVHVIEHIDDVDSFLQSLRKLIAILIVEVPDFEADALNLVRKELDCPYYSDGDHVREYTLTILRQQLERNGWAIRYSEHRGGAILAVAIHDKR
ncbi:MAG: class I SAM-dependent methyltransferase [Pyrinomonadaceae bacterium]